MQHPGARLGPVGWTCISLLLHALIFWRSCSLPRELADEGPIRLPAEVEFGIATKPPGGGDADVTKKAPPPRPARRKAPPRRARARAAPDPNAYALAAAARTQQAAAKSISDAPASAAASGEGEAPDAAGAGLGDGMGPGSGYAPQGATIALNVDLQRVRKTALVLETQALLEIIPEWQLLLAGSGIDPMQDLERVFVASPTLERASVVVAADHGLAKERIAAAVSRLASEQGQAAAFQSRDGYKVAPWRNRGPTERSIALTADRQFTITRTSDLARVLQVADSLAQLRTEQGVAQAEIDRHGGFLAMEEREAVALWVLNVQKYVRGDATYAPQSLRLSLFPVDQFNTELRVRAQYPSAAAASEALGVMDGLRRELSDHPKVMFLGLKSAIDKAQIEQLGSALRLQVRLTLHQTRYLMGYVTRALKPRTKRHAP